MSKRRKVEVGLVALGLSSLAIIVLVLMVAFWQVAKAEALSRAAPHTPASHGPDVSHCFAPSEARSLWDCIRYADVTNLVTEEDRE